jgi:DNA-binding NtrC family response regulator
MDLAKTFPRMGMRSILVVDDDSAMRDLLVSLVRSEGFEVRSAASVEEALEGIRANGDVDVVVSDVELPGQSGYELLRKVVESRSHTRVILMSAFGNPGLAAEARRKGAFDYVAKPFQCARLLAVVQRALEERSEPSSRDLQH